MNAKMTFDEVQQFQKDTAKEIFPLCAIIENIRSMYNVGSIFRTADGAGIKELTLVGYTAQPPRKEIEKTALGSTESVLWNHFDTPEEAFEGHKCERCWNFFESLGSNPDHPTLCERCTTVILEQTK